uniref:uncharacterized protein LOC696885 isoform X2 n=1 Tax=Macaca mulatta TaxID=9544 RepID=UPI00073297B1|nr:uncharacterized protein LOC696885 isoform X2 [Macaca mulatta]XP_014995906.1 uncharacterized protein LOC696885 isoform X2 [Macaca mulatta]
MVKQSQMEYQETCYHQVLSTAVCRIQTWRAQWCPLVFGTFCILMIMLRRGPGSGQQSFLRCDVVPLASCSENSQQHRSTSRKHRLENSPPWFCLNWLPFCSTHQIQLLESGTREENQSQRRPVSAAKMVSFMLGTMERPWGKQSWKASAEELDLQETDLHDNHHHGSSLVPASTLNQMQYNFHSS